MMLSSSFTLTVVLLNRISTPCWFVATLVITIIVLLAIDPPWLAPVYQYAKIDLIGHFFGFLLLTMLIHQLVTIRIATCVVGLICYAGLTELGQAYLGYRNGAWDDFIADSLGILCYGLICLSSARLRKNRIAACATTARHTNKALRE